MKWTIRIISIVFMTCSIAIFYTIANLYDFIGLSKIFFYINDLTNCCYEPYELLEIKITLISFLGGIYLVILNIVLEKKKINLKYFFMFYKYKHKSLYLVFFVLVASIFLGLLISSFERLRIFHYVFLVLITNSLISFFYLFYSLFDIDSEETYRNTKIKCIVDEILKVDINFDFKNNNFNINDIFKNYDEYEKIIYFSSILEYIRKKFQSPALDLEALKYFKNILE